jgi:TatD DNase family protein
VFDAHRHFDLSSGATSDALYATSTLDEWQYAQQQPKKAVCSLGLLPSSPLIDPALLYERLVAFPHLQIGEVGLDRRFDDLENQKQFLDAVLEIGYQLGRSVSLHCVRADGHLLDLLRSRKSRLPVMLWHGCTASSEVRTEAIRLGVLISYGPTLYRSNIAKDPHSLIAHPWVLESDWEGPEEEYMSTFNAHIKSFALLTGLSEESVVRNNDEKRAVLTNQSTPR